MIRRVGTILILLLLTCSMAAQDGVLDFEIETNVYGETGEGYIYISNFMIPRSVPDEDAEQIAPHLLILDNEGEVHFSKQLTNRASNFFAYPDGTMVYHNQTSPGMGGGVRVGGGYIELDSAGNELRSYNMQGHPTALHDIIKLDNGNVILFTYDRRIDDMTAYGGSSEAITLNIIIQEIQPDNTVVWEWSGWDHFKYEDTVDAQTLQAQPPDAVDYVHPNALTLTPDGNLLLSSRDLDEITKISRETGEILWRLGGKNSDFEFVDDPLRGFTAQHMPVLLGNGNLLLFDNGVFRSPPESRAVEYALDLEAGTATYVWSYSDGHFASVMGSVQRLENGNTLIGWGNASGTDVTEVTPDGDVVFDLTLPEGQMSFRAYRLPIYGEQTP